MNERFQELLNQVGGHGTKALMHPDDVERFAMLVVADCMEAAARTKHIYESARLSVVDFTDKNRFAEADNACWLVKQRIEKQFGLKHEKACDDF